MPIKKLKTIPEPPENTRTAFRKKGYEEDTVIIRGEGDQDYICGKCGALLVSQVEPGQLKNLVFHCNQCGSFNEIS